MAQIRGLTRRFIRFGLCAVAVALTAALMLVLGGCGDDAGQEPGAATSAAPTGEPVEIAMVATERGDSL